jgi:FKBP-type peptidyl-prolyl cis-trans isomerase 2
MLEARSGAWLLCLLLLALAPGSRAEEATPEPAAAAAPQTAEAAASEPAAAQTGATQVVKPGDWVWIDFALWEQDGNLLETTTHSQPLRLKHGAGKVPIPVEQAMLGMAVDEHKTVRIPPEAEGQEAEAQRFESVALDSIPESTRFVGHPIVRDDDGVRRAGRVHEIEGDRAVIDWHPISGQTLTFDFRIVEIYVPDAAE